MVFHAFATGPYRCEVSPLKSIHFSINAQMDGSWKYVISILFQVRSYRECMFAYSPKIQSEDQMVVELW